MSKTAIIMAGGTGGHIFPGLAVAEELRTRGWKIIWLGSKEGMENRLVPQYGITLETIPIQGLRGNGLLRQCLAPFAIARALYKTKKVLSKHPFDIALGFGGYVAFPGAIVARLLGKPLVIHEQNAIPGLTNRLLSRIANRALHAFPGVFSHLNDYCVGNPVRREIVRLPDPTKRFSARQGALRLLVIGGSLGAKIFNDVVPEALSLLSDSDRPHVVHQAGAQQIDLLSNRYAQHNVVADCRAFIDRIADEYARADIVLCRAGALTVAELAAAGMGSLLVPYPFAVDDHQTHNATLLLQTKAAHVLPQSDFSAKSLAQWIGQLNRERCLKMAIAARKTALIDAHVRIADICTTLLSTSRT